MVKHQTAISLCLFWGYSRGWGYGPSGIVGVVLVVLLMLLLVGRSRRARHPKPSWLLRQFRRVASTPG
jgi:hypothetical protein